MLVGCWERMYLSFAPYWYALEFMLEWFLVSTEHSRKESSVLGAGLLHFPGMFFQQLREKHEEISSQEKVFALQLLRDAFTG